MTGRTWLILGGALVLGSCGGTKSHAVFVEARWALQCDAFTSCPLNLPNYDYLGSNGEGTDAGSIVARCEAVRLTNGDTSYHFSTFLNGDGVEIDGMVVAAGTTNVTGLGCGAVFHDGPNAFQGGCNAPSEASDPCTVTDFAANPHGDRGPEVSFRIKCDALTDPAIGVGTTRNVRDPSQLGGTNPGAFFRFANCSGL